MNPTPKLIFSIDRMHHVFESNLPNLIEILDVTKITSPALNHLCDSLQIFFSGYDNESRVPYAVPEIRRYLRLLRQAWPYAPFFCSLNNSYLAIEIFCQLHHLQLVEYSDSDRIQTRFSQFELFHYVRQAHNTIANLGSRAEMSPTQIKERKSRFDEYVREHCGAKQLP